MRTPLSLAAVAILIALISDLRAEETDVYFRSDQGIPEVTTTTSRATR